MRGAPTRRATHRRGALAGMLLLLAATGLASAGSLSVAPIRVGLSAARPTQALTVRNAGDEPVVVQATGVRWSQADGVDRFDDTRDVLVTPAVFTIPANDSQVVRVGMRAGFDASLEKSYRLFLQEVPAAINTTGAVRVALRLSLPVFAAPLGAAPAARVNWSARRGDDGQLAIIASNTGTAHLQIVDLALDLGTRGLQSPANGNRYVLPGAAVQWTLALPERSANPVDLQVRGRSTLGEFAAPVAWSGY